MTTYTSPFTGQTINPSSVSYESLSITANTTLDWPINGTTGIPASNIIDITATAGLSLTLPPATQVSTGQTILIRNIGSNPITVRGYSTNNSGPSVVSIASGVANYIYLTNNSTDAGTWATVVLGAGTSSANAATLAGYGLQAIGTTLNQIYSVDNYYSDATLPATEQAHFVVWSSGAGTLTLPSAGTVGEGWFCQIRNGGTGILTIAPAGTDTIGIGRSFRLLLLLLKMTGIVACCPTAPTTTNTVKRLRRARAPGTRRPAIQTRLLLQHAGMDRLNALAAMKP